MTPEERILRRFYDTWGAGDIDAAIECIHPEMDFDWTESQGPFMGVFHGHDGMRRYWHDLREAFDEFQPEIDEIVGCGAGGIVTRNTVHGRSRSGGITLEAHAAMHWLFRDGKIVRGKMFQTVDDALEAVGGRKEPSI